VFILAACSSNQNNDRDLVDNLNVEEELQALEEAHNVLRDLGFNLPEFGSVTEFESSDGGNTPKTGYTLVPIEVLSLTNPGRNSLSGNRYYADGYIMEIGEDFNSIDFINLYLNHEENEHHESIAIVGEGFMDLFSDDMMSGQFIRFYIEYIGFSEELGLAFGVLESFERIDPF